MARKSTAFVVASWVLVVLCAGFIFFMSSNTDTGLNDDLGLFSLIFQDLKALQAQLLGPGVDVVSSIAHFCEYAVFGALLANALRCHMRLPRGGDLCQPVRRVRRVSSTVRAGAHVRSDGLARRHRRCCAGIGVGLPPA